MVMFPVHCVRIAIAAHCSGLWPHTLHAHCACSIQGDANRHQVVRWAGEEMTNPMIIEVSPSDYDELAKVWEASVRATHDFLTEADIAWLRPQVRDNYFPMVQLRAFKRASDNQILGFVGVAGDNVEMLFVAPDARGQGVGRQLLAYAVQHMDATTVDVNEQNPQAVGFYEHEGFEVTGRSPLDGQGKPFPLLHMRLRGK